MIDEWFRLWSEPVLRERPVGDVDDLLRHQLPRVAPLEARSELQPQNGAAPVLDAVGARGEARHASFVVSV